MPTTHSFIDRLLPRFENNESTIALSCSLGLLIDEPELLWSVSRELTDLILRSSPRPRPSLSWMRYSAIKISCGNTPDSVDGLLQYVYVSVRATKEPAESNGRPPNSQSLGFVLVGRRARTSKWLCLRLLSFSAFIGIGSSLGRRYQIINCATDSLEPRAFGLRHRYFPAQRTQVRLHLVGNRNSCIC